MFSPTPRNTGVFTRHPTFVTATSGVLTRLPAKLSKNGMCVYTLSDRRSQKKIACLNGLRSEGVKQVLGSYKIFFITNLKLTFTFWIIRIVIDLYTRQKIFITNVPLQLGSWSLLVDFLTLLSMPLHSSLCCQYLVKNRRLKNG